MTTWNLSPQYKKSAVEVMFFTKGNMVITIEQGYRWANFKVESDERPLTDEELVNEDGYELGCIDNGECWEMWDMNDGCWLDIDRYNSHVSDEEFEAFEAAWEEDSFEGVEALGWSNDDTEYHFHGPLTLTNEDTGEEFSPNTTENIPSMPEAPVEVMEQSVKEFVDRYADFVENMSDEEWEDLGKEDTLLTSWYPVETNPVRNGTYQVLHDAMELKWPFESNVKSAVWDGKKWDDKKVLQWRGLTEEVK